MLFATRGDEAATKWFQDFKANGKVLGGNKQVALAVSSGELAIGLTDTDDAILEVEACAARGDRVSRSRRGRIGHAADSQHALPDQERPASRWPVVWRRRSCRSKRKRRWPRRRAQIPLNAKVTARPRVLPERTPRWMKADFESAAEKWEHVRATLSEIFAP